KQGLGPAEVRRVGGKRAALVTARIEGTDLGSASEMVERTLEGRILPPTSHASLSGQNEEMRASLRSLVMALLLAVFLVYLVLASTFESLRLPFIVILTVPLGLIGAVAAIWVAGLPVGVLAMIGVILLSGIVVNNGIIFVARIQQHQEAGMAALEAAHAAGLERMRPILITSMTTILGLLPLALGLGAGAELRRPLAITVIGGLVVATLLTLQVVPCGYRILGGSARRAGGDGDVPKAGDDGLAGEEEGP
ncbi:MAG: efflux RND transporter permease subunit, partial [Planctomycetota bacterium]